MCINVNLNGTFYCTSAALPSMIEQKFGRIINISSFVGQAGNFGQANYAASKGGIIAFTKSGGDRDRQVQHHGQRHRAWIHLHRDAGSDSGQRAGPDSAKIPMERFAKPEEVAKAAAFLATDGDYITGQQLNINGGLYM